MSVGSAVGIVLASIVIIDYRKLDSTIAGHPGINAFYGDQDNTAFTWLSIILGFMFLVALITNVVRKKLIYFIMCLILVALTVSVSAKTATTLRVIRQSLEPGEAVTQAAVDSLKTFHEDDLSPACAKYLAPSAQSCGKSYETPYAEGDLRKRALDPSCGRKSRAYLSGMIMNSLILILLIAGVAFTVGVACLKLSDTTTFIQSTTSTPPSILDWLSLAVAGLTILIFFMYLAVSSSSRFREFRPITSDILTRLQRGEITEPDYTVVPLKISSPEIDSSSLCTHFDTNNMISVSEIGSCSKTPDCGYRVFILAESTNILGVDSTIRANSFLRSLKFPGALNSLDGYAYLRGTPSIVNNLLRSLRFCQTRYNKDLSLYFLIEKTTLSSLSLDGLAPGENPAQPYLDETGQRVFPADHQQGAGLVCEESSVCKFATTILGSAGSLSAVGQFYAKDAKGNYGPLTREAKNGLRAELFHGQSLYAAVDSTAISDNGYFSVNVPASSNTPYELRLLVTDSTGRFVKLERGFVAGTAPGRWCWATSRWCCPAEKGVSVLLTLRLVPINSGCLERVRSESKSMNLMEINHSLISRLL